MTRKAFTLIELIAVIVIIGLVSVVAIPKFVNVKSEAAVAQAQGVYGAAQSAASLNYAKGVLGQAGHTPITTGATLLSAMANTPVGWTSGAANITATINGTAYTITITTGEVTGTSPAVLTLTP